MQKSKKVHKKNIKPKGDIELTNNDYKETILDFEENEIIETSDIEILDEFQAEKVEDVEIEPIKADNEKSNQEKAYRSSKCKFGIKNRISER